MITADELSTNIRSSARDKYVAGDDTKIDTIITEVVSTVRSYIGNRYDADTLLSATGTDRDAALLRHMKAIVVFDLASADMKQPHESLAYRYEEARRWLEGISMGKISPAGWPMLTDSNDLPGVDVQFGSDSLYETDF